MLQEEKARALLEAMSSSKKPESNKRELSPSFTADVS